MSTKAPPARIHLLTAKEAPIVVVIRRKPSRLVHIMRWNTETDEMEHGSWFNGRIYEMRCDLSFDGKYMIYLAMGASGETWTGVCEPPYLRTLVDWPNEGTWEGGGMFSASDRLAINPGYAMPSALKAISKMEVSVPFQFFQLNNKRRFGNEGVLFPRLERDGFKRVAPIRNTRSFFSNIFPTVRMNDSGWILKLREGHPVLRVRNRGYFGDRGRVFEWDLPEHPGLLDEQVSWAACDCLGQLVFARLGVLYRYTHEDLLANTPTTVIDLEPIERPERNHPKSETEETS